MRQAKDSSPSTSSARIGIAIALATTLWWSPTRGFAQPAPAPPAETPPAADASEAKKDEARNHFELGLSHLDREEWSAALVEFQMSRALFPSKGNTKNTAICLRKLGRFDESLDLFETLLRNFPDLSATERTLATREIEDLRASVGTLELLGAPAGASVTIDGVDRGQTPFGAPLRLAAGSHGLRVSQQGSLTFEARVDLVGRQAAVVQVRLTPLMQAGHLRVTEHGGSALDIVVDGAVAGRTPSWEGTLQPGNHIVYLRGGTRGTQPTGIGIRMDEVTTLDLTAEELGGELRVEPEPRSATVSIDGVAVGRGAWEGRLRVGSHRVTVTEEGYAPYAQEVSLAEHAKQVVVGIIEPLSGHRLGAFAFELDVGVPLGFLVGGDLQKACKAPCAAGFPVGFQGLVHGAYSFRSGFGLGIHAGYALLFRSMNGLSETITQGTQPPHVSVGTAQSAERLGVFLVGADAQYKVGQAWPLTLRLGAGVAVGSMREARTGSFVDSKGGHYLLGNGAGEAQSSKAIYFDVAPEIRFGRRFGEHVELNVGVQLAVLTALSTPAWDGTQTAYAGGDGIGLFPTQSQTGKVVVLGVPGVGFKVEL